MIWLLFIPMMLILHPVWSLSVLAFYFGGLWVGLGVLVVLLAGFAAAENL